MHTDLLTLRSGEVQGGAANLTGDWPVYEHCIKSPLYILDKIIFTALQIQTLPGQNWFPDKIFYLFIIYFFIFLQ